MKVFSKVDTFASWQYGTIPYLPAPTSGTSATGARKVRRQRHPRELEQRLQPELHHELRAWSAWTMRRRSTNCWARSPRAISAPPTGTPSSRPGSTSAPPSAPSRHGPTWAPTMPSATPCSFRSPGPHGHLPPFLNDHVKWMGYFGGQVNPYWPFTVARMVFVPDFTNKLNKAEQYARSATGIQAGKDVQLLPVFLKYLRKSAEEMEQGLKLYRPRPELPAGQTGKSRARSRRGRAAAPHDAERRRNPRVRGLAPESGG